MSNPHFPYRVVHTPAECVPSCDDRECPYVHRNVYDVFLRDALYDGPFSTNEDAVACIENAKRRDTSASAESKDSTCVNR